MRRKKNTYALVYDIVIIVIGIFFAIVLSNLGFIDFFVSITKDYYILSSFIAGIFFTSAFTLAPSSVALASIAEKAPIPQVALWGGLGAMCGDLILFFFIRDRFYNDIVNSIKPKTIKHILRSFHFGFLKWIAPIVGALIIASPLPDEFGIALLSMSKVKTAVLMPVSFIMNALGIYLLITFASFI